MSDEGSDDLDPERVRFCMELEFVQSLSNPAYLHFLAQRRYFEDPAFLNYLAYLKYWMDPPYTEFIQFPQSLFFLDMLQDEGFRRSLVQIPGFHETVIHRNQFFHWLKGRAASVADQKSVAKTNLDTSASASASATAKPAGGKKRKLSSDSSG